MYDEGQLQDLLRLEKLKEENEWKRDDMEPGDPAPVDEMMYGKRVWPSYRAAETLPTEVSRSPETMSMRSPSMISLPLWKSCRGTMASCVTVVSARKFDSTGYEIPSLSTKQSTDLTTSTMSHSRRIGTMSCLETFVKG